MKRLLLSVVCAFIALQCFSQRSDAKEWNMLLLDTEKNFNEIKEEFYKEWEGKEYAKGKGWKQFKRWEAFWENRLLPDGSFPKFSAAFKAYKQFLNQNAQQKSMSPSNWSPLGPFDHVTTESWSSGTGRVNVVVQDPNNSSIIYVGAPAGGVWKSVNSGSTWTPLSDDLAVIGISGIAIDPNNSNNIYVTTGDSDGGNTYSIGVWKSTDAGSTWSQAGADFGQGNKILIDPTTTSTLWVASNSGLYKSTNSGTSWTEMLSGNIRDIALKPNSPQTVYATTSDKCFYTTNGGATFTESTGLPGGTNRIAVTTSAAAPNTVYILAADGSWGYQGVYRSLNSGESFQARNTTTDIFDGSTQAWYDMAITVSDTNPNTLIAGVLNLWKSTNGGTTWSPVNSWSNPSGAAYTHADIHYLEYFGGNLYCGSDGGIYKSTNNASTFNDLSSGLQIGQFYTIAGSENDASVIAGGLQDNGGYAYTNGSWKCYYGADGMGSAVNPNSSNQIWGMIQNGSLYYTSNGGFNLSGVGSPEGGRWITPMCYDETNTRILAGYNDLYEYEIGNGWNQISTHDFDELLSIVEQAPSNANVIYASTGSQLAKTTNGGVSFTNLSLPFSGSITALDINATNPNEIWITRSGWNAGSKVYHSVNGGSSWTNITLNLPNLPSNVLKYNESNGGLYLGMDIGVYFYSPVLGTWVPFNEDLPNVIVTDLEINEANGIIRSGTYGRGVWQANLYNVNQVDLDAMMVSINSPVETYCNAETVANITIRNIGTVSITSLTAEYGAAGATPLSYSWTGALAPGTNVDITLPSYMSEGGENTFEVILLNPNGEPDQNQENNSASSNYSTIQNGSAASFNLLTDCYSNETSWSLVDGLGNTIDGASQGSLTDDTFYENEFCLSQGCYSVVLNDSYGDGLTSSACSDGSFNVTDGNGTQVVGMGNPNFGGSITLDFCLGAIVDGCIDPNACNFSEEATVNDNSCDYSCTGCIDPIACNYDENATISDSSCDYECVGCMDSTACNYDDTATNPDNSCDFSCYGCTDVNACNYDSEHTIDDGSCTEPSMWYLDSDSDGFGNDNFTTMSCSQPLAFVQEGGDCDDLNNTKYPGAQATGQDIDNNCDGEIAGDELSTCQGDFNNDGLIGIGDLAYFLSDFGCELNCLADFNEDGIVGAGDLSGFLSLFGVLCD
ncbi:MAG: glycosyl hydrolase [Flavobacteriales bacterium]